MAYQLDPVGPEDRVGDYAMPEDEDAPAPRRRVLATALTLLVMAAFAGGLWFAYHQGRRAAGDGSVPLIRADKSPIKVRPADPGGKRFANRDMLVFGEREPATERLLPPPEQPLPKPAPPMAPPAPVAAAPATPTATPQPPVAAPTPAAVPPTAAAPAPTAAAPAAAPAPAAAAPPAAAPAAPRATPPAAAAPPPQTLTALVRSIEGAAPEKPAAAPAKAAPMAAGGARVQLGSLHSEAAAREEWQRLRHANPDLLDKLSLSTRRADLGERGVYYRLLAGPVADANAARRLCGELKERGIGCLVAR